MDGYLEILRRPQAIEILGHISFSEQIFYSHWVPSIVENV